MSSSVLKSEASFPTTSHSNLDSFIDSVTPTVPSQVLPKSCIGDLNSLWNNVDKEKIEYFTLADLWNCYDEWSAYGAGVPIVLNSGESVVQYYVPYLSAIQIYTSKSVTALSSSSRSPKTESEPESDSWSDDSSGRYNDSDGDKLSRSLSNSSRAWDAASEDSSLDQEGGTWPMRDRLGYLYFQSFETAPPYFRVPLMEKISEFAQTHPALMTLRSVDISPASWMAVAWYPIYHIPTGRTVKDLSTCFLTFHTLSSSFQDAVLDEDKEKETSLKLKDGIALAPFGLASYKMFGYLWIRPESDDYERISSLHSAADSWLKQLRVQHHDFSYFSSRSPI